LAFLENRYEEYHLFLNRTKKKATEGKVRTILLGPPVHRWSVSDLARPEFLTNAFAILKSHVENLRVNRQLRESGCFHGIHWETGKPSVDAGTITRSRGNATDVGYLRAMVPSVQRLLTEIGLQGHFQDIPVIFGFVELMKRRGVDPDPTGACRQLVLMMARVPYDERQL
jgi:hypothetical protein